MVRIGTSVDVARHDPLVGLRALQERGSPRSGPSRRNVRRVAAAVLVVALVGALLAGVVIVVPRLELASVTVQGIDDGAVVRRDELDDLEIRASADGVAVGALAMMLNGEPLQAADDGGALVARPGPLLRHGENRIDVTVEGIGPFGDTTETRIFTAYLTGPSIDVPAQLRKPVEGDTLVVRGLLDGAVGADVGGVPVDPAAGAFRVELTAPGTGVLVRAIDANGTIEQRTIEVTDDPARPDYPSTGAVRVGAAAWNDELTREAVLDLARQGRINAVVLDVKDESGRVGYPSRVALAVEAGAVRSQYDPAAVLGELEALGVRLIGRVVCFLDPVLARWAWERGDRSMVVQSGDRAAPLASGYGEAAFTNLADPAVQQYLVDLSVEAAGLGFDEILLDYIRRPEGSIDAMAFPGLDVPADVAVARFVRALRAALVPTETELGVSVFGIAATRPEQIAQDISLLAPHVDYVAPMVYPSHWGPGEYGVPDPNRMPGDIVERSVADFHTVVDGSGAAVVPWLQDFSQGGVTYGDTEVRAQVAAALRTGSPGYLLWNAGSLYHGGGLDPAFLGP